MCSKCSLRREIDGFSRNKARPDGMCIYCKPCNAAAAAERRRNQVPVTDPTVTHKVGSLVPCEFTGSFRAWHVISHVYCNALCRWQNLPPEPDIDRAYPIPCTPGASVDMQGLPSMQHSKVCLRCKWPEVRKLQPQPDAHQHPAPIFPPETLVVTLFALPTLVLAIFATLVSGDDRSLCCPQVCGQCKRDLPAASYHRSKSCKDGITGKCKECCAVAISQRKADRDLESVRRSSESSTVTRRLNGGHDDSSVQVRAFRVQVRVQVWGLGLGPETPPMSDQGDVVSLWLGAAAAGEPAG